MKHIRPHRVLDLVSAKDRMVYFLLPNKYSATLTIESAILISLIKILRPTRLFEFGTYLGEQTLNMAANIPDDGVIYTLDLDEKSFEEAIVPDVQIAEAKRRGKRGRASPRKLTSCCLTKGRRPCNTVS